MTEARLFSRHSIGTRIAALFMLLILVIMHRIIQNFIYS